jgi:hypothetical protein
LAHCRLRLKVLAMYHNGFLVYLRNVNVSKIHSTLKLVLALH